MKKTATIFSTVEHRWFTLSSWQQSTLFLDIACIGNIAELNTYNKQKLLKKTSNSTPVMSVKSSPVKCHLCSTRATYINILILLATTKYKTFENGAELKYIKIMDRNKPKNASEGIAVNKIHFYLFTMYQLLSICCQRAIIFGCEPNFCNTNSKLNRMPT